jgi:methionyl-tRNA formyltransferase
MNNISKTIVFFGSGPVAAESLKFIAAHFAIEAVVTKSVPVHHKEKAPVETLAASLGLPIVYANTKKELDIIVGEQSFNSQLGIIIDYGVIVSTAVIESFPLGIINSHFSLLPEWRGADPITFSVLSGQEKTGVSLMVIDTGLDTGKLLTRKSLVITPTDTTPTLTEKLIHLSNQLLLEYIPQYQSGDIKPKNQPHPDRATYSRKLQKSDGIIDWSKPAVTIEREIRAYAGWPQSKTILGKIEVIITTSHTVPGGSSQPGRIEVIDNPGILMVDTTEGYLCIDSLKPIGKKEMPVQAFLRGYRSQLD